MRYSVELRRRTEQGDYIENHYTFDTKEECIRFAIINANHVHSVLDYEDRDYNPIDLSF